jgi:hypothetical protein
VVTDFCCPGVEPKRGAGKEFPRVVGVTGAPQGRRQRGIAPMGSEATGSRLAASLRKAGASRTPIRGRFVFHLRM